MLGELAGDDASGAGSVNKAGVIVGESALSDGSRQRAVLWDDNGVADLNMLIPPDSGWDLWSASAINDKGQIVGYGRYNGDSAVFLLTPDGTAAAMPEPAACMLVGLASAGLLLRRRRQR
jgi:probable HAF family extracellular repeat protein